MKQKTFVITGLASVLALGAWIVVAAPVQPKSAARNSIKLDQTAALMGQGRLQEARALIATIGKADPDHPQAMGYDALCLYGLKDGKKFLSAVNSPEVRAAELPPALREELDYEQVDMMFTYGKFSDAAAHALDFQENHPASVHGGRMLEFLSAGLFTQGMRDVARACTLKDDAAFKASWVKGESNLLQFLDVAAALGKNGYKTLPDRDLKSEIRSARIALGDEANVLKETAALGRKELEEASFLNAQLHKRLQPYAADDNLRLMSNFVAQFPSSKHCKRVNYDMAGVAFEEGWRLTNDRHSKQAASYLATARRLYGEAAADKDAGISDYDVLMARVEITRIYYAKRDWPGLSAWASQAITNLPPGSKEWLFIKLNAAAGLACQKTKQAEAAAELDEMLATGFKGNPSFDGPLTCAAEWRIRVAKETGDTAAIPRITDMVQQSGCYDSLKRTFAKNVREIMAQQGSFVR